MTDLQLTTIPRDLYYHEVAYVRGLETALKAIRDGLADTKSMPGQRMTLITKADAYEIARTAIAKGPTP